MSYPACVQALYNWCLNELQWWVLSDGSDDIEVDCYNIFLSARDSKCAALALLCDLPLVRRVFLDCMYLQSIHGRNGVRIVQTVVDDVMLNFVTTFIPRSKLILYYPCYVDES